MKRYTEYHSGVAVIKDKSLLPEAMKKLAKYEDAQESRGAYRREIDKQLDKLDKVRERKVYYLLKGFLVE